MNARAQNPGHFAPRWLGKLVNDDPSEAAAKIADALRSRSEIKAATKLGVGLRSLRRYRRVLESAGYLERGLAPRGRRPKKAAPQPRQK